MTSSGDGKTQPEITSGVAELLTRWTHLEKPGFCLPHFKVELSLKIQEADFSLQIPALLFYV